VRLPWKKRYSVLILPDPKLHALCYAILNFIRLILCWIFVLTSQLQYGPVTFYFQLAVDFDVGLEIMSDTYMITSELTVRPS
jgi:hypothetical protein